MVAFDGSLFERPVHAFHLPIGPRVIYFGQAVLDVMLPADTVKDMRKGACIFLSVGELDTIICQNGMDLIGHDSNQVT